MKVKIFATLFIVVGFIGSLENLTGVVILLLGLILFGVNFELEIFKDFKNKLNIKFLSLKLFSQKEELIFPDYISISGQSFSTSNEFGTISALGSKSGFDYYVIRFFDENNRNELVFKTKNKAEVLEKGKQLAELLNVDLLNKLEH